MVKLLHPCVKSYDIDNNISVFFQRFENFSASFPIEYKYGRYIYIVDFFAAPIIERIL